MTFYPTTRATLLLVAIAPLALLLAAAAEAAWVLAPLLGLIVLALVVADAGLAGRVVDVRLIAPGDAEIGELLALTVLADFAGKRGTGAPQAALALDPRLASGGRSSFPLAFDPASASWSGEARLVPNRRGSAPVSALWLRWSGPLGLAWRALAASTANTFSLSDVRGSPAPHAPGRDKSVGSTNNFVGASARRVAAAGRPDFGSVSWWLRSSGSRLLRKSAAHKGAVWGHWPPSCKARHSTTASRTATALREAVFP